MDQYEGEACLNVRSTSKCQRAANSRVHVTKSIIIGPITGLGYYYFTGETSTYI